MSIPFWLEIMGWACVVGIGLRIGWDLPSSAALLLEGFIRGFKRGYNSSNKS